MTFALHILIIYALISTQNETKILDGMTKILDGMTKILDGMTKILDGMIYRVTKTCTQYDL